MLQIIAQINGREIDRIEIQNTGAVDEYDRHEYKIIRPGGHKETFKHRREAGWKWLAMMCISLIAKKEDRKARKDGDAGD